jgi:hypothetical protein
MKQHTVLDSLPSRFTFAHVVDAFNKAGHHLTTDQIKTALRNTKSIHEYLNYYEKRSS